MKAQAFLSAILGFLFGLTGYIVLLILGMNQAFGLAVFSGLLFALLLFGYLVAHRSILNKRYAKFEEAFTAPVFYKTNGNLRFGSEKVKNGNIYFCETGILFVSLEGKPDSPEEIPVQDIDHFSYTLTQLNIFTNDGRLYVITVPKVDEIIDVLIRKGWILPK